MVNKKTDIRSVLERMYEKHKIKQKINEIQLITTWQSIVGPLISQHTKKIELRNKTLYVQFDNAPLKNEMFYRRFEIVHAINEKFGINVVEKIFVH